MICFPLDNTSYEAKDLGAYMATRTRGVFSAEGNFAVTPGGNFSVKVSPGIAWLKMDACWGTVVYESNEIQLTPTPADGVLSRIDAVCLRLNKNLNKAELVLKQGAPAASPVIPPITRDLNADEIYVATLHIAAGMVQITPAAITDQRLNEAYCGLMRDGVTGIPTAQLQAQAQALMELIRQELEGLNAGTEVMLKTMYDPTGRGEDIFAAVDAAQTKANTAQTAAGAAQTTANAAMPKAGGTFTGNVVMQNGDLTGTYARNIAFQNASGTNVASSYLVTRRK